MSWLPLAALITGLAGSLHCVGMCGPLVSATTKSSKDLMLYQTGRLIGYFILGILLQKIVSAVIWQQWLPWLAHLTIVFMSGMLMWWAWRVLYPNTMRAKNSLLTKFSKKISSYHLSILKWSAPLSVGNLSFFTGLLTFLLPCGLLYVAVMAAAALGTFPEMLLSLFFFWLGTLPLMFLAPHLIHRWVLPLAKQRPKFVAFSLLLLAALTLSTRLTAIQKFEIKNPQKSCPNCH
jgi:sulfite exporter TauE/SafE